jgi:hypothetical protein
VGPREEAFGRALAAALAAAAAVDAGRFELVGVEEALVQGTVLVHLNVNSRAPPSPSPPSPHASDGPGRPPLPHAAAAVEPTSLEIAHGLGRHVEGHAPGGGASPLGAGGAHVLHLALHMPLRRIVAGAAGDAEAAPLELPTAAGSVSARGEGADAAPAQGRRLAERAPPPYTAAVAGRAAAGADGGVRRDADAARLGELIATVKATLGGDAALGGGAPPGRSPTRATGPAPEAALAPASAGGSAGWGQGVQTAAPAAAAVSAPTEAVEDAASLPARRPPGEAHSPIPPPLLLADRGVDGGLASQASGGSASRRSAAAPAVSPDCAAPPSPPGPGGAGGWAGGEDRLSRKTWRDSDDFLGALSRKARPAPSLTT